jgi:hypothetical protein
MTDLYDWDRLGEVPARQGIYAWYYRLSLSASDLRHCQQALGGEQDKSSNRTLVRELLDTSIFQYLAPGNYVAECSGDLMPRYQGNLEFISGITDSYIDKIVANPSILDDIRRTLATLGTFFSAPLYIGMSRNLYNRIASHHRIISSEVAPGPRFDIDFPGDWSPEERSFANEVRTRALGPNRLSVAVKATPDISNPTDIEYLLNRISYPVFGSR